MRAVLVAVLAAAALCSASPARAAGRPPAPWPWLHTRCVSDDCRRLVTEGANRSQYLRALLEELERTDVIVHIVLELGRGPAGAHRGAWLSLTVATGQVRYLRVTIDKWHTGYWDTIPLLAHELQHAMEVAREPAVRSTEGFEQLYRRIGWGSGAGDYETEAARAVTRAVRAELGWAKGARPPADGQ